MTTAMPMQRPTVPSGADTDPQLTALLARQGQLEAAIERRAAEVVRAWLLDHDRTWLAVDFTKTRPEPPFDGDDALGRRGGRLRGVVAAVGGA